MGTGGRDLLNVKRTVVIVIGGEIDDPSSGCRETGKFFFFWSLFCSVSFNSLLESKECPFLSQVETYADDLSPIRQVPSSQPPSNVVRTPMTLEELERQFMTAAPTRHESPPKMDDRNNESPYRQPPANVHGFVPVNSNNFAATVDSHSYSIINFLSHFIRFLTILWFQTSQGVVLNQKNTKSGTKLIDRLVCWSQNTSTNASIDWLIDWLLERRIDW